MKTPLIPLSGAELVAHEAAHLDVFADVRYLVGKQIFDGLVGLFHERLIKQAYRGIVVLHLALDNLLHDRGRLAHDRGRSYLTLLGEIRLGHLIAGNVERIGRGDLEADAAQNAADALWGAESASLDLADAYDTMNTAVANSVAVSNDETASQQEKDAAYREVRRSQIAAAEAAGEAARKYAEEQGAVDGSRESISLQIQELQRQKDRYPELGALIDAYIAKLKSIPSSVTTGMFLYNSGGGPAGGGSGSNGSTGGSSGGGRKSAGVGGVATESVGSTRGAVPGLVVNLTVNVQSLVPTAETGRIIGDAIQRTFADGTRWPWTNGGS